MILLVRPPSLWLFTAGGSMCEPRTQAVPSPYATKEPSVQQTLDLFRGKWASRMPAELGVCEAGDAGLFADPRVDWAIENLARLGVSLEGSTVLELGPLEGGHTFRLSRARAASVTAVEAHPEAYLKCLLLKELLGMERVNFLYGDAVSFLRKIGHSYDIGFASGFLYHMARPVEFLDHLCQRTRALFLWTVYWDEAFSKRHPDRAAGTSGVSREDHAGFAHTLHRHDYGGELDYGRFWGGGEANSNWMEKDEILGALAHFGFARQIVELEENPNGSALKVAAVRP
jgi:hypothetical protein